MTYRLVLPVKMQAEEIDAYFNFQDQAPFGSVLSGALITVIVEVGEDPAPMDILSGTPSLEGDYTIKQRLTGGVSGVTYALNCSVYASPDLQLSKQAFLSVLDPNDEF